LRQLNISNCLIVLEPLSTGSNIEDVRLLMLRNSYAAALARLGPWAILALGPRHSPTTTKLIEQLLDQDTLTSSLLEKILLEARQAATTSTTPDFSSLLEGQFELFYTNGDFRGDAAQLAKDWHEAYGDPVPDQPGNYEVTNSALSDCAQDIGHVVSALLDGPFDALRGLSFQSVENIPSTMQEQLAAYLVRDSLLNKGLPLQGAKAHILLAGAQLAFQTNPQALLNSGPSRQQTQADLIQRIVKSRTPGTRAVTLDRLPQLNAQSDAVDKTRGRKLAQELLAAFEQQRRSSSAP
jgi:hypothetical protein